MFKLECMMITKKENKILENNNYKNKCHWLTNKFLMQNWDKKKKKKKKRSLVDIWQSNLLCKIKKVFIIE